MRLKDVMKALEAKGSEQIKRILMRHGAPASLLGVRIGDMKPIAKQIKGDQALAMELFATGIGDAQYLAGMVADGAQMSRKELQSWASGASWLMVSGFSVAWVASENDAGWDLALEWIDSKKEHIAIAGWTTLAAWVTTHPDAELDLKTLQRLLARVEKTIHTAPDQVKVQMNYFVIALGTYVAPLGAAAIATARRIGKVEVDVGDTDCKIPDAESYIIKSRRGAAIAPKRKTVRC
jgi:3-methyladenine DNA glycosylase AlkD